MFYVYVLKSKQKNYIYVGLSNNPERRIKQHNDKKERTTRCYSPFKTLLVEEFFTRNDAREREKYLKSGVGKEYIKQNFI